MFNFRDQFAREADRSPTSLISDQDIVNIVLKQPTNKPKLLYVLDNIDENDE